MSLQRKENEELEQLLEAVNNSMETAASAADLKMARQGLLYSMERLIETLAVPSSVDESPDSGKTRHL